MLKEPSTINTKHNFKGDVGISIVQKRLLFTLIFSSLLMFICLFPTNSKIFAFGLTQFVLIVTICFSYTLKGFSLHAVLEHNEKQFDNAWRERKFLRVFAYGSAVPAVVIGILTIIIMLAFAWWR